MKRKKKTILSEGVLFDSPSCIHIQ